MALEPTRAIEMVDAARDSLTVGRVFGEPIERGDTVIIPCATIRGGGGAGGGMGTDPEGRGEGQGGGGGFGLEARPAGVFVVTGDSVRWEPALDVNRVILAGQIVALAAIVVGGRLLRRRRRRRH